ncbi:uncharacterized protein LOC143853693 [Tasmannia lanceolata]|uniref:uncharacterized protein LOC143853693 n=1 Tax=Tasmannia lanceolata TaxID=3420 RepID=UPI0040631DD1
MEGLNDFDDELLIESDGEEREMVKLEEEEDEFQSCLAEEDEWRDMKELTEGKKDDLGEFGLNMFFKGVSIDRSGDSGCRLSGIGVVMVRSQMIPLHQVQKKLDFYVEESVAEHLALMDGLLDALQKKDVRRVFAFTDSEVVYDQISRAERLDNQLLIALRERILEYASQLEVFVLKLVPTSELEKPLRLAQEAIGIIDVSVEGSMCCDSEKIYCPYPSCSALINPRECLSMRASSSSQSESSCVECPDCQRFICIDCGVPWHSSMSCDEYQNLPVEERDAGDITLHRLAQNQKWRRCQQCRRMIELTRGCYHMSCRCGHEFCYSCGAEYREGLQTCQCAFWDDDNFDNSAPPSPQDTEPWRWDSYGTLPMNIDAYSDQERSQLALIQRFLSGGFSLTDNQPCQSPPHCSDSYVDTMKDLHQLPWLERFISVMSDNYCEDHVQ